MTTKEKARSGVRTAASRRDQVVNLPPTWLSEYANAISNYSPAKRWLEADILVACLPRSIFSIILWVVDCALPHAREDSHDAVINALLETARKFDFWPETLMALYGYLPVHPQPDMGLDCDRWRSIHVEDARVLLPLPDSWEATRCASACSSPGSRCKRRW